MYHKLVGKIIPINFKLIYNILLRRNNVPFCVGICLRMDLIVSGHLIIKSFRLNLIIKFKGGFASYYIK